MYKDVEIIKKLISEIEREINNFNLEEALKLTSQLGIVKNNIVDIHVYESIIYFYMKEYDKAESVALEGIKKWNFNFELSYNLAIIYETKKDYLQSIKYYTRAMCLATDKEELKKKIKSIYESIKDMAKVKKDKELMKKVSNVMSEEMHVFGSNNKLFPYEGKDGNYINKFYANKYYVALYDKYGSERDNINFPINFEGRSLNAIEMYEGLVGKDYINNTNNEVIIPICSKVNNEKITIDNNVLLNKLKDRFYYYKIDRGSKISTQSDVVFGKPIELNKNKEKKSIVLNIFVDGLAQSVMDEFGMENIMPNTYRFFSEGTICTNAYSVAEWTLPSVASIFSGKYTVNHGIYHPNIDQNFGEDKILSELFKNEGYFTAKIDGNWRNTVPYGYYRGIDRTIYKVTTRDMNVDEIVTELIEHMESFKETNQFIWTCAMDLHHIADGYELKMPEQITTDNKYRSYLKENVKTKSVNLKYSENKKQRYLSQIKRIDTYLALVYSYLLNNFSEEEILVSLISDHGQSYLIKNDETMIAEERIKVPMLFRGGNVKKGICSELISTVDYMKIIYELSGGKAKINNVDGKLPKYFGGEDEREYTFTESIYEGHTYKVLINFKEYYCFFETMELTQVDGKVNMDKYKIRLVERNTKNEFYNEEIKDKCLEIIFKHRENTIKY